MFRKIVNKKLLAFIRFFQELKKFNYSPMVYLKPDGTVSKKLTEKIMWLDNILLMLTQKKRLINSG